jgi:hypothetical protein
LVLCIVSVVLLLPRAKRPEEGRFGDVWSDSVIDGEESFSVLRIAVRKAAPGCAAFSSMEGRDGLLDDRWL